MKTQSVIFKHQRERTNTPDNPRKSGNSRAMSSPAGNLLFLQKSAGNQAVQRMFKAGMIQAKPNISNPYDIYEQEADRVAAQVTDMPEPIVQRERK